MMRYYSLFLLLACTFAAAAQKPYAISALPDSLREGAAAVIRYREVSFEMDAPGEATLRERIVVSIFNAAGKRRYGTLADQEDDFYSIRQFKGKLYDAAGNLFRESEKGDVKSYGLDAAYEFTGNKVKVLELEYPTFPYTVEYIEEQRIRGYFRIPEFVAQYLGEAVEYATFTVIAPPDTRFLWQGIQTDVQPEEGLDGKRKTWRWTFKNLPAEPDEAQHPYFGGRYRSLLLAPEKVQLEGYAGKFDDWKNAGRFLYSLKTDSDQLSAETQAAVRQMVAGVQNDREKIAILYRYMQQSCRYVSIQLGIGGWQTLPADFVEKKKYGDCKALSNYMKALLKVVGIESWVAVIYAGEDGAPEWQASVPSPIANHMILYVPGTDMWLECTSQQAPCGYLGDFTADRQALLLTPEGGVLKRTPALQPEENFIRSLSTIRLDEQGGALLEQQFRYGGARHDTWRNIARTQKADDLQRELTENIPYSVKTLQQVAVSAPEQTAEARLSYQASAGAYATVSGKRMFLPVNKCNPLKVNFFTGDKRRHPIRFREGWVQEDSVYISLPAGHTIESMPPEKVLEQPFGRFSLKVEALPDGRLLAIRRFRMEAFTLPPERYADLKKFLNDVRKADGAQMVFLHP
jgi:transglutaminase-like putative cysteine protease